VRRILFVCMGNICRSPTAEGLLRVLAAQCAPGLELQVDSAGTHGYHVDEPPDARAQRIAAAHGVDMSMLRARQLCIEDFERFDEILVMDRQNLLATTALAPARYRDRIRLLLDDRDVPDPYYSADIEFERVFGLIEQAVRSLLSRLQPAAGLGPGSPAG
jgi:protein-tyrosine phosphatase